MGNWRNKTIGHGTLFINTEAYWEQVYDLVQGLFLYFGGNGNTPLKEFYGRIFIEKENDGSNVLKVGEQTYPISEYILIPTTVDKNMPRSQIIWMHRGG